MCGWRADEPFAFALGNLPAGNQRLAPGTRPLLVRVMGGRGPYRITLANATGQTVAEASGGDGNLHLPAANLTSGRYHLTARDSGGGAVEADITVATRPEAEPDTYQAISDPEVRAAATAAAIARQRAATSALEAEQLLAAAPMNGLDRGAVYDLTESYWRRIDRRRRPTDWRPSRSRVGAPRRAGPGPWFARPTGSGSRPRRSPGSR